jgi:hypothetical protein
MFQKGHPEGRNRKFARPKAERQSSISEPLEISVDEIQSRRNLEALCFLGLGWPVVPRTVNLS